MGWQFKKKIMKKGFFTITPLDDRPSRLANLAGNLGSCWLPILVFYSFIFYILDSKNKQKKIYQFDFKERLNFCTTILFLFYKTSKLKSAQNEI